MGAELKMGMILFNETDLMILFNEKRPNTSQSWPYASPGKKDLSLLTQCSRVDLYIITSLLGYVVLAARPEAHEKLLFSKPAGKIHTIIMTLMLLMLQLHLKFQSPLYLSTVL